MHAYHGDIRILFDESPDDVELFVEVVGPDVTNVAIRSSFRRHPLWVGFQQRGRQRFVLSLETAINSPKGGSQTQFSSQRWW